MNLFPKRIRRRIDPFALLTSVISSTHRAHTRDEVLAKALTTICRYIDWPVGHAYVRAQRSEGAALRSSRIWYLESPDRYAALEGAVGVGRVGPGEGLAGRVIAARRVCCIGNLRRDPEFGPDHPAVESGLRAAFAFPVLLGQEVVAVLEFFSSRRETPHQRLLQAMAAVAVELALALDRASTEAALHSSGQRYRLLFEHNVAGLFLTTVEGRFLECNQALARILGFDTPEELLQYRSTDFYPEESDREKILTQLMRQRAMVNVEHRGRRRDGRLFWALASGRVLEDPGGGEPTIGGTLLDVSELKEASETVAALLRVSKRLNATLELETILSVLVEETITLTGAEGGLSGLPTPEGMVCHKCFRGREEIPFECRWTAGEGLAGWLLHHKMPYLTNEASTDPQIGAVRETLGIRSALSVPILDSRSEVIGFFEVHNKPGTEGFTGRDRDNLTAVSQIASIAIQNALAYLKIRKAEQSLRQLSARLLRLQDEERRRFARELHDSTAQNISAIHLHLAQLAESRNLDRLERAAVRENQRIAEQCLRELRTLSYLLHPPLLDQLGLISALRWYAEGFSRRSGVRVRVEAPLELGRLAPDVEMTLFRVVQECLSNIHRHSGSDTAEIGVRRDGGHIVLEVRDAGRGIPAETLDRVRGAVHNLGVGILGMEERLRQLGGKLEIESGGNGATVRAWLPLLSSESLGVAPPSDLAPRKNDLFMT